MTFRIFSAITSACLRAALIVRHGYYRGASTNIANRVAARHVDCVRSPVLVITVSRCNQRDAERVAALS